MKRDDLLASLAKAMMTAPQVAPLLSDKARYVFASQYPQAYKSQEYMTTQIRRLVSSLYNGYIGGEFIDTMANVISGQLRDAIDKAWEDYGETGALPSYLETYYQDVVSKQYGFVDQYYRDIVDARIDETPIDPLLFRADLWGNRWNEAYNEATNLITQENGGNLIWQYGEAEHCDTCRSLNGIVASAKEWQTAGVKPQNAPNNLIHCGGWQCKCTLTPTTSRRSPKAFDSIMNIIVGRTL